MKIIDHILLENRKMNLAFNGKAFKSIFQSMPVKIEVRKDIIILSGLIMIRMWNEAIKILIATQSNGLREWLDATLPAPPQYFIGILIYRRNVSFSTHWNPRDHINAVTFTSVCLLSMYHTASMVNPLSFRNLTIHSYKWASICYH